MLPVPRFEKMPNFTKNKKRVFQDEIVINLFNIHCELGSVLLLVKTVKKRGSTCSSFVVVAITYI